jgi:VanZ family protein
MSGTFDVCDETIQIYFKGKSSSINQKWLICFAESQIL